MGVWGKSQDEAPCLQFKEQGGAGPTSLSGSPFCITCRVPRHIKAHALLLRKGASAQRNFCARQAWAAGPAAHLCKDGVPVFHAIGVAPKVLVLTPAVKRVGVGAQYEHLRLGGHGEQRT